MYKQWIIDSYGMPVLSTKGTVIVEKIIALDCVICATARWTQVMLKVHEIVYRFNA